MSNVRLYGFSDILDLLEKNNYQIKLLDDFKKLVSEIIDDCYVFCEDTKRFVYFNLAELDEYTDTHFEDISRMVVGPYGERFYCPENAKAYGLICDEKGNWDYPEENGE